MDFNMEDITSPVDAFLVNDILSPHGYDELKANSDSATPFPASFLSFTPSDTPQASPPPPPLPLVSPLPYVRDISGRGVLDAVQHNSLAPSPLSTAVASTPSMFPNRTTSDDSVNGNGHGLSETGEIEPSLSNIDGRRDSSEEKDLTPAQSRRKAQNRAAQRAFRERKEKHVKELEAKLNSLESTTHTLQTDNERLKLALQRATTENEILRATSGSHGVGGIGDFGTRQSSYNSNDDDDDTGNVGADGAVVDGSNGGRRTAGATAGARDCLVDGDSYLTGSYAEGIGHGHQSSMSSGSSPAFASANSSSMTLLSSSAAWDFIQAHPLFKAGQLDVADVTERLRKVVRCDGHGPGFEKADVKRAIEQSRISSSDELI